MLIPRNQYLVSCLNLLCFCVFFHQLIFWIIYWSWYYVLGRSNDVWNSQVVETAMKIVTSFLSENGNLSVSNGNGMKTIQRDLWTQYTCKVCYIFGLQYNLGATQYSVSYDLFVTGLLWSCSSRNTWMGRTHTWSWASQTYF